MNTDSILCPVRVNAEAHPDSPAIITAKRMWSWSELDGLVGGTAEYLCEIAPSGSRVAVRMPNSVEFVTLILAAFRTGHVLAPISTRVPQEVVAAHTSRISAVVAVEENGPPILDRKNKANAGQSPPISFARPATIIQTSGSTGKPKAALLTVGNHVWSARGLAEVVPLNSSDRWLLNLPMYHVGGLAIIYRCALAGAAIVLPDAESTTGVAVEEFGVTHASLVSTQLYRLLEEDRVMLDPLKAVLLGGSAFPSVLLRAAAERRIPIYSSYGLTEMSSTVALGRIGERADAGAVLPYREVEMRDGEITVRGRTRFVGYLEGDRLVQPFDQEGWFGTGDLGCLDESGSLVVTGRKDNQFVSGGENIQPEEIEAALMSDEMVISAIVVPVSDSEFGFRPVAFVETNGTLDSDSLRETLTATLPRFKLPVAIYSWPSEGWLKPNRSALRDEAERRWRK